MNPKTYSFFNQKNVVKQKLFRIPIIQIKTIIHDSITYSYNPICISGYNLGVINYCDNLVKSTISLRLLSIYIERAVEING